MASLLILLEDSDYQHQNKMTFVDVVLPLPLVQMYTYSVPFHLLPFVKRGVRVEVQLGNRGLYSGLIYRVHKEEKDIKMKPILSVLDDEPILEDKQFRLWDWISQYYCCTLGEVMQAALPAGFKLSGETKLNINEDITETEMKILSSGLDKTETYTLDLLAKYGELTLVDLQKLLNKKTVQPLVKALIEKGAIVLTEELQERYRPKKISMVRLQEPFSIRHPETLKAAFELVGNKANRQLEALMALLQLLREKPDVSRKELCERASVDSAILKKLEEKGVFELYEAVISRLESFEADTDGNFELSEPQKQAFNEINTVFETKNTVLLYGITGSGKTQVFVEMMEQCIREGRQVLYLLPEIALTTQIVGRLQKHFEDKILVYHSKFNKSERVEIWREVQNAAPIILGARSSMFLPFADLGLIIVDEEHDPSYKQQDPAPRYNARDSAIFLAQLYNAKTILGSATPSLETMRNVQQGKYGIVTLKERFGGVALPKIVIVDATEETKQKRMKSHFTQELLDGISETIIAGEQVILFQNRRGYAPMFQCASCGWTAECVACDVSLTYHKHSNDLNCHYCAYREPLPKICKSCGSADLKIKGFGTEKIEDELKIYLPELRIQRMDWDTVKGRTGLEKIIDSFGNGEVDVLVGTQMVSKGLDFDNVGLVGVLSADLMLHFPDFRSSERSFQMMTQVAGRAGRREKQGRVIIQAFNLKHPVLREILQNDFENFLVRELQERKDFHYPPFVRLIHIQLRNKKPELLEEAAKFVADRLKAELGNRVLGPAVPGISRLRSLYLIDFLIKMGLNSTALSAAKIIIIKINEELRSKKSLSGTRMVIDVDPY